MSKLGYVAAMIGSALAGAVVWEGGPDPVIYPPQVVPVHFTHDYHVRKPGEITNEKGEKVKVDGEGLKCTFCHDHVSTSTLASDRDIPGHAACESCHEEWIGEKGKAEPVEQCARCHTDPNVVTSRKAAAELQIPAPNLRFSHKQHLDAEVTCGQCHVNVAKKTVATRDDYPTMDRCIACHQSRGVSTACKTCHFSLPSGRLVTDLPEGKLEPRRYHAFAIHDADFLRDHATPAKRDKAYCNSCHAEDFCMTCHDGVGRNLSYHPGDWLALHGTKAKLDDVRCQSCHRLQTYCLDCHVRSGVATVSRYSGGLAHIPLNAQGGEGPGVESNTRRTIMRGANGVALGPHPMADNGWLSPASRNFHGFYAQRNIRTCASCHQEQFCITCHASHFKTDFSDGRGGNPHGPNPQRLKGSVASQHTARMCLKCHSPADPSWR